MDVILREDVPDLGRTGDVINVSRGYARNFLIPQDVAVEATRRNLKQLEHQKREISKRAEKQRIEAASLAERLVDLSITVAKPTGAHDKLYGSVTSRDVAQGLLDEGITGISHKQVVLGEPIRQLGIFSVRFRLDADHTVDLKVWVVAKD